MVSLALVNIINVKIYVNLSYEDQQLTDFIQFYY